MPLQATSGAASYDGFGGGVPSIPNYIEEVFSTYLYTGTGTSDYQAITNNINLTLYKGLVWIKRRDTTGVNGLYDSVRDNTVRSNTTAAQGNNPAIVAGVSTTGFSTGNSADANTLNGKYTSWTFRKQPKFFDIVTYTGTGANTTIAHNLGSVPGMILVKSTNNNYAWAVYHRSLANTQYLVLNTTAAVATGATYWNSTTPTSAVFSVGTDTSVNGAGVDYVAYVFAHDAGGFGLTGTDNVISCGSFTTDGSGNATVSVGYEPQWVMYKGASGTGGNSDWVIADTMRGYTLGGAAGGGKYLAPNSSQSEGGFAGNPTATGFVVSDTINTTYIYMAIRRGPMKVPTLGTSVFQPYNASDTTTQTVGFPTDMCFDFTKSGSTYNVLVVNRLVGTAGQLTTQSTGAENNTYGPSGSFASNTSFAPSMIGGAAAWYSFGRAAGFFDVVCYSGSGVSKTINHNLTVVPELIIVRARNRAQDWRVLSTSLVQTGSLNGTTAFSAVSIELYYGNDTIYVAPTSSVFTIGTSGDVNAGTGTYVAYLFATCAGVSKVGSYTGNGTTQTINCGFTGGARFVLIKRTDATGDWYVYDTARGMTLLTDPYLLLNSTAAEVATLGSVTTVSTGFALDSTILAAINVSAGTYIFLAIA